MSNCVIDENLAAKLEKDGFVVVPICSAEQLSKLAELYTTVEVDSSTPFWSSSFLSDTEFKSKLSHAVAQELNDSISEILGEHQSLGSSYLVKFPGEYSEMPIHQDWTVVDEEKFGSYTFWIPLEDTTPQNGALQVIPGSHKLNSQLRSPSIPVDFENIRSDLRPYLQTVRLKAGEAILFNHALMHASPPNLTNKPRVAVTYGFVPKEAQLHMYYGNGNTVKKYNMPSDMFIKYPEIRTEPLIGEFDQEFEYTLKEMTMADLTDMIGSPQNNSKMTPLFNDPELQASFEKNGFVKIPALGKEEIDQMISLYSELNLKDEKGYGFHVGMDNPDKSLVRKMVDRVKEVALPKIEDRLAPTQLFTASFVVKEPNPQGVVPPHQDWSFVEDEEKHCSVTCWIPLQDVNMENGCIGVIRGSNRFFKNVRPSPSPQVETPLKKHMYTIFPYLELQEMKAGEALIFDNRTFHASPPNVTDSPRLAIGLGFTQADAEIRHYYLKPGTDDTLVKYKIDPDFFFKYDNLGLSKMYDDGKMIEGYEEICEMPYKWEDLTDAEMKELIQSGGNTYNVKLVEAMTKLFVQAPQEQPKEEPVMSEVPSAEPAASANNGDNRSFWETYTPGNIIREVKYRITGKA